LRSKKSFLIIFILSLFVSNFLLSSNPDQPKKFTIASYNAGGLPDHYDYLRAVALEDIVKERSKTDKKTFNELGKIQAVALKILFTNDPDERATLTSEWEEREYSKKLQAITESPQSEESINHKWYQKSITTISPYNVRPIIFYDSYIVKTLRKHILNTTGITFPEDYTTEQMNAAINKTRSIMAKKIFKDHLAFDIIALQEADYINPWDFPNHYKMKTSTTSHSINAIVWNSNKFTFVREIASMSSYGYIIELKNKETGQHIAVASAHLKGCNPFSVEVNPETQKPDSERGSNQLKEILAKLENSDSDIKIIAMDSNVCASHPRLSLLKESDYKIDYNNALGNTCTSPIQILNTRIDWIGAKSNTENISIRNIDIAEVKLNSHNTNISDHRPVASEITTKAS